MSHIIDRHELSHGAYLALWIPWHEIEFDAARTATKAALTEELGSWLDAIAEPAAAREAIGASNAAREAEAA